MLRFRVVLNDVEPPVWRRVAIPEDYTFWDLHVALQDAMGWDDAHLHEFEVKDPASRWPVLIGVPDEECSGERPVLPGWEVAVAPYLGRTGASATYRYDFGDDWEHTVTFEGPGPERGRRPLCLGGERACPPENVGGPLGFVQFLEAIADPEHDEHEAMLAWIGRGYDPERFVPERVRFDDPTARWKTAFGWGARRGR